MFQELVHSSGCASALVTGATEGQEFDAAGLPSSPKRERPVQPPTGTTSKRASMGTSMGTSMDDDDINCGENGSGESMGSGLLKLD